MKDGFTLAELMVVVAIIGILAAVGIPSFQTYQAKSKTTEAKIQMAAGYSVLTTFQAEYDTYANCFPTMGYDPSSTASSRYYMVGAAVEAGATPNFPNRAARANGATSCADTDSGIDNVSYFQPGKIISGRSWSFSESIPPGEVALDYFNFVAFAYISPLPFNRPCQDNPAWLDGSDVWVINQNKRINHDCIGY